MVLKIGFIFFIKNLFFWFLGWTVWTKHFSRYFVGIHLVSQYQWIVKLANVKSCEKLPLRTMKCNILFHWGLLFHLIVSCLPSAILPQHIPTILHSSSPMCACDLGRSPASWSGVCWRRVTVTSLPTKTNRALIWAISSSTNDTILLNFWMMRFRKNDLWQIMVG